MAPYNNSSYGTHYDPVGSQYNQQQQGYTYSGQNQRSTTTPQYIESSQSASTYQPSYQTAYANSGNSYYNSWTNQTPQPAQNSTEDRAAETLSHLSVQDQTTAASRAASGQYAGYDSTYTPSMTAQPASVATRSRDTNNSSPVYQLSQPARQRGSASSYTSAQSCTTATATPTYQYVGVYGNSAQNPSSAAPNASTRPSQSPAKAYRQPATASKPHSTVTSFRPNSPYIAQQQQQSKQVQSNSHKDKASTVNSIAATTAQSNAYDQHPANVGQPRAPGVTPSSLQQQHNYGQPRRESMHDSSAPTTVDPSQVYDRWPEQQQRIREAERRRAEEEAEKAKKEEFEKKLAEREEATRFAEQAKKAEETRKVEEARKAEQAKVDLEAKKVEDDRRAAQDASDKAGDAQSMAAFATAMGGTPPVGNDLEAEILAMFKKMRDFNEKNPSMLARLWDQERRAHIAKVHSPAASPAEPAATRAIQPPQRPAQPTTSKVASAAPIRIPSTAAVQPLVQPLDSTAVRSQTTVGAASAYAGPAKQNAAPPSTSSSEPTQTSSGPAIWPPGKKSHLAGAAAKWLNARPENAGKHITPDVVVTLLDSNPSYLLLCESLESIGLSVDRAAFARALLSAVPDVNKHQGTPQVNSAQPIVNADVGLAPPSAAGQANVRSISPAVTPSSDVTTKKNKGNTGRFGSVRGRPKKDVVPTESVKQRRNYKGNLKQIQTSSGGIVDRTGPMTSTRTGESSVGPSLAEMYQNALANDGPSSNTVAYQSTLDFEQPPSAANDDRDDYQAAPALPKSAPRSIHLPSGPKPSSYSSPYISTHFSTGIFRPDGQRYRPKQPQPPSRPPANKEEAARKRNFADLVDLTAADDSEEEDLEPSSKYPNFGLVAAGVGVPPPPGPGFVSGTQSFDRYMYDSSRTSNFGSAPQAPMQATTQASIPEAMQIDTPPTIINLAAELKGKKLVDGIKREKVARKSRYDSRTICRDVLLATGRHPDMKALNEHLFEMHEFLKPHAADAEGDKFDLATIRWDLIDPGEPIPDATTEDKAYGALTDEGEVAETEEEPGQAVVERQLLSEHDRETTTGFVKHRKPFPKKNGRGRPRKSMPNLSTARATGEMGGETSDQADGRSPRARASTALSASRPPASSTFTPVNKLTRHANMSGTPSSAPVGYAAFNQQHSQLDEFGKPIKRKGRPVGWRKSVHSKAAVAAAGGEVPPPSVVNKPSPNYNYNGEKRRPGRPPKHIAQSVSVEPEAKFNVFKCEWEGCTAELHNLDTLRKHVIKLHGKKTEENDYECFWKDCLDQGEDASFVFAEMTGWLEHVEKTHLKPMARLLGDGPRLGLSGS